MRPTRITLIAVSLICLAGPTRAELLALSSLDRFLGAAGGVFGASAAVSDDVMVVGYAGGADLFQLDGTKWVLEQKLVPSDAPLSIFGTPVATDSSVVLIKDLVRKAVRFG